MATEKLNLSELKKMIISEAEKIMSLGDPLNADMNKMTNPGNSTGDALVMSREKGGFVKKGAAPKAAENIEEVEDTIDVDMNDRDNDQGHDEQIAAAVKVDAASSTKKGASVEGMKNSNFESKDKNPSTASSTPFEERKEKVEMNSQDKADNSGAKTYVEPGSELHNGASTGQHAAKFSEKAQNEKETAERIATGIQLPESFKNKSELINFINEQAKQLSESLEVKTLNESVNKELVNEGTDYTGNLARANNEEVGKLIPILQQVAGSDIKNIISKVEAAMKQGTVSPDIDTRNVATAIGSMAYTSMGE